MLLLLHLRSGYHSFITKKTAAELRFFWYRSTFNKV